MKSTPWIIATVVVAAGVIIGATVGVSDIHHSHAAEASVRIAVPRSVPDGDAASVPILTSAITIEAAGNEELTPPTPAQTATAPALTAEQAWTKFAAASGDSEIALPSDDTVQLGDLTYPLLDQGPVSQWTYHAKDQLVYGVSSPVGPCTFVPNPNSDDRNASPGTCVPWIFIDANTGAPVDVTQQPIAGPLLDTSPTVTPSPAQ
jgi:hypothetical protein